MKPLHLIVSARFAMYDICRRSGMGPADATDCVRRIMGQDARTVSWLMEQCFYPTFGAPR